MKKYLVLLAFLLLPNFAHAGSVPPNCAADGIHGLTYASATNAFACTVISLFNSILPIANGGTNSTNIGDAIQVFTGQLNASSCANMSFHPAWCAGSDVGAWVNAAIAYATAQSYYNYSIILNAGSTYAQTTTIVKPLAVKFDCQGSKITRAATSGAAMTLGTFFPSGGAAALGIGNQGGTWNCKLFGAGGSVGSHSDIAMYSGTDPLGIITGANIYGALDFTFNVEVSGFNTAYTYGSNTWQVIHYNPEWHDNYDGIVNASGTTKSGELMQVIGGKVYDNQHCGFNLGTLDHWWMMTGGALDYNVGGAVCGTTPNIVLNNVHVEQSNAPLFNASSLDYIRVNGGTFAVTAGSAIGGENGWVQATGSDAHNSIALTDVQFFANHLVPYIIYTNGKSAVHQCTRNLNWGFTNTAYISPTTDATGAFCVDNAPINIKQQVDADQTITVQNTFAGRQSEIVTFANSNFSNFSSTNASSNWVTGLIGTLNYWIEDVTNNKIPFKIVQNSPTNSLVINTLGVGFGGLTSPAYAIDVTGDIQVSGQFRGAGTGLTGTAAALSIGGTAATATALATPRAINGVNFDGTAAITVTAAAGTLTGTTLNSTVVNSSLTSVGTLGSLTTSGAVTVGTVLKVATAASIGSNNTATPYRLNVTDNTSTTLATSLVGNVIFVGADGSGNAVQNATFGNNGSFTCYRGDGTQASQTALQSGEIICSFSGVGWNGAALSTGAAIRLVTTEIWDSSHGGAGINFEATPNGSTTRGIKTQMDGSGNWSGMGTISAGAITSSGSTTANRFIATGSTVATNGMYLPAANTVAISTNSIDAIKANSAQHVRLGNTTGPTVTSCGGSPAMTPNSNDMGGTITEGTAATGCIITFATAFSNAPSCLVTGQAGLVFSYAVSASAITVTNVGALSSTKLDYACKSND